MTKTGDDVGFRISFWGEKDVFLGVWAKGVSDRVYRIYYISFMRGLAEIICVWGGRCLEKGKKRHTKNARMTEFRTVVASAGSLSA